VTRGVNNQKTRDFEIESVILEPVYPVVRGYGQVKDWVNCTHPVDHLRLLLDRIQREEGGSNLLGDTSRLTLLYVGLTHLENAYRVSKIRPCSTFLKLTLSSNFVFPVST
jgi:hypothetical protein